MPSFESEFESNTDVTHHCKLFRAPCVLSSSHPSPSPSPPPRAPKATPHIRVLPPPLRAPTLQIHHLRTRICVTHAHAHAQIHTIQTRAHVHMHAHTQAHAHANTRTRAESHNKNTHTHVCPLTQCHVYTHRRAQAPTHTRTNTLMRTHNTDRAHTDKYRLTYQGLYLLPAHLLALSTHAVAVRRDYALTPPIPLLSLTFRRGRGPQDHSSEHTQCFERMRIESHERRNTLHTHSNTRTHTHAHAQTHTIFWNNNDDLCSFNICMALGAKPHKTPVTQSGQIPKMRSFSKCATSYYTAAIPDREEIYAENPSQNTHTAATLVPTSSLT